MVRRFEAFFLAGSVFRRGVTAGALAMAASIASSCGTDENVDVHLLIVDNATQAPLAGALVSVESGGIYVENSDTSKGSAAYQYGGVADAEGKVTLSVPADVLGFHVFAAGHRYAPRKVTAEATMDLTIPANPALAQDTPPTLTDAAVDPATVAPGGSFTIMVTATAANQDDPLSDETIAILEGGDYSVALDPPSKGQQGVRYPDGQYKKALTAPNKAGTYVYHLVTTTEGCLTGDPVAVTLTVQ